MADTTRQIIPDATPEDEALLREVAAEYGVEVERTEDTRGPEVLIILAVVGAAAAVAGAVADYLERRKGGQVFDLRKDAQKLAYRDPGVVYGLILIIAEDGKVTVDVKEPKGFYLSVISEITTALTKLGEKSISAVADAAKAAADAVGAKTEVKAEPAA